MPQIGWFELLLIVIIAILVIGPKDFPIVLRKVGSWIKTAKSYFSDVQQGMREITDIEKDDIVEKKSKDKSKNEQ